MSAERLGFIVGFEVGAEATGGAASSPGKTNPSTALAKPLSPFEALTHACCLLSSLAIARSDAQPAPTTSSALARKPPHWQRSCKSGRLSATQFALPVGVEEQPAYDPAIV